MLTPYRFFYQLMALPFVEGIWLFGSRARGDNTEHSDIDLAILCPKASLADWSRVMKIIENADTLLKIDCIRFDSCTNDKLKENIIKYKCILYEKESGFMAKEFWKYSFNGLGDALDRFEEVMERSNLEDKDDLQELAIHRFQLCIEFYWKILKKCLSYEKVSSTTPRDVLEKSFQFGLIHDEALWLQMMDDRNITSHVYTPEEALQAFHHLKSYLPIFRSTYKLLKEHLESRYSQQAEK